MKHALTFALLLTMIGCVRKPLEGRQDPYAPGQINFTDSWLRRHTTAGPVQPARDQADILYITVPIRNTTDNQFTIDYRVTFFDNKGQVLNPNASWMPKVLAPNVPDQIRANSYDARAADVQVDIRPAQ